MQPAPKKKQQFVEYRLAPTSGAATFARPSQHRLMLQDFYRTLSFRNALLNHVRKGMTVLEIGTGTGILSYFAVQAGAEHVFTIEASDLADTARDLLAHNGCQDRVTVIKGMSFDVNLPRRADLLVTETLGHAAFDEGILELTHDARTRLLTPEAVILPGKARLLAAPVNAPEFMELRRYWYEKPYGYDLAPMEPHAVIESYVSRFHPDAYLSDRGVLVERVMGTAPDYPLEGTCEVVITRPQTVHGFALSFISDVSPYVPLDSRGAPSWQEVFLPIPDPFDVAVDERMTIAFSLERPGTEMRFTYRWSGGVVGDPHRVFSVERA